MTISCERSRAHVHSRRFRSCRRLRRHHGFTLLEMIAALALLALAMVAASGGIGAAVRTMLPSTDAIEAAELAHAKLDAICVADANRAGSATQQAGTNARAHWQLTVAPGTRTDNIQLINARLLVRVGERHYRFDTVCAVNAS